MNNFSPSELDSKLWNFVTNNKKRDAALTYVKLSFMLMFVAIMEISLSVLKYNGGFLHFALMVASCICATLSIINGGNGVNDIAIEAYKRDNWILSNNENSFNKQANFILVSFIILLIQIF